MLGIKLLSPIRSCVRQPPIETPLHRQFLPLRIMLRSDDTPGAAFNRVDAV